MQFWDYSISRNWMANMSCSWTFVSNGDMLRCILTILLPRRRLKFEDAYGRKWNETGDWQQLASWTPWVRNLTDTMTRSMTTNVPWVILGYGSCNCSAFKCFTKRVHKDRWLVQRPISCRVSWTFNALFLFTQEDTLASYQEKHGNGPVEAAHNVAHN